jgi:hypothetical protein
MILTSSGANLENDEDYSQKVIPYKAPLVKSRAHFFDSCWSHDLIILPY